MSLFFEMYVAVGRNVDFEPEIDAFGSVYFALSVSIRLTRDFYYVTPSDLHHYCSRCIRLW